MRSIVFIIEKIKEFFRNLIFFWRYKKILWEFRPWDWTYNVSIMRKSFIAMLEYAKSFSYYDMKKQDPKSYRYLLEVIELLKRIEENGEYDYFEIAKRNFIDYKITRNLKLSNRRFNISKYSDIIEDENVERCFKLMSKRIRYWWI